MMFEEFVEFIGSQEGAPPSRPNEPPSARRRSLALECHALMAR